MTAADCRRMAVCSPDFWDPIVGLLSPGQDRLGSRSRPLLGCGRVRSPGLLGPLRVVGMGTLPPRSRYAARYSSLPACGSGSRPAPSGCTGPERREERLGLGDVGASRRLQRRMPMKYKYLSE